MAGCSVDLHAVALGSNPALASIKPFVCVCVCVCVVFFFLFKEMLHACIVDTYPLFLQHSLGRFCRKGNSCQGQSRHRLCRFPQQCENHETAQT